MPSTQVMTLSLESIEQLRSTLSVKGRSEKTVKAYTTDLRILLKDMEETQIPIEDFEETAMNWLQYNRTKLSAKTTGRRLTSLRVFAKFAGHPEMLKEYSAPTPAKGQPHPLPEGIEGVERLIIVARKEPQKALIALCGLCGCRVSEALGVRPSHLNLNEMILTIHGKGDKERWVPVSSKAWNAMAMSVTHAMILGDTPVVGIKDRFARRVITDLGTRAGLQRRISSHDLRATFATAIYDRTQDIRLVQELLGHSSVETTQLYTGVKLNKMREAVDL